MSAKRILVCRTDKLGDVILALPSALLVKRMFPDSRISFLAQPYTAPLVRLFSGVDEVLEFSPNVAACSLTPQIEAGHFDAAIVLYPTYIVARAVQKASIPLRAGIAYRWYSRLFTYRHKEHRKHNLKHELEYNLTLTYRAFLQQGDWKDYLDPAEIIPLEFTYPQSIAERIKATAAEWSAGVDHLIILHPGGGGSAHRWSLEHFIKLAQDLRNGLNCRIILTGIESERNLCDSIKDAVGARAVNLCGQLSLSELACVLRYADLLVTNSTGPLHLCRAVGTEVIGLFPSDHAMSPVRWGPYGKPDGALTPPPGKTMVDLSVEQVLNRLIELLGVKR
ncbi:MAG: glycosyltransferase family 9 protein [bacterium]